MTNKRKMPKKSRISKSLMAEITIAFLVGLVASFLANYAYSQSAMSSVNGTVSLSNMSSHAAHHSSNANASLSNAAIAEQCDEMMRQYGLNQSTINAMDRMMMNGTDGMMQMMN